MEDRRFLESRDGDLRRVELIADEFLEGFEAVAHIPSPTVSMFGSARVTEDHPAYLAARETARRFAEAGWSVVTGGGPGCMEAANRGAKAFVIFPGGFGTLDEMFEALTLIQTGKIVDFPVVLFGRDYWGELVDWLRARALAEGMINADDLDLLYLTDDPAEALAIVVARHEAQQGAPPAAPAKADAS
jgi:predicted Rossmann-fold nucleotide-binding protein